MNRLLKRLAQIIPVRFKTSVVNYVLQKYPLEKQDFIEFPELNSDIRYVKQAVILFGREFYVSDSASFLFIHKELFKDEIYRFSTSNVNPYIIDAGANIGLSVLYFKLNHPNASIVAFEPDPVTFEIIKQNITNFELKDVELVNRAVWNKESKLRFFSEGADGGRLAVEGDEEQIIEVETVRLRSYLNRKVDFLKIDIEGAECEVLEDCFDLLNNVDRLFVEFHSFVGQPQKLDKILTLLSSVGFRYHISHVGVRSLHPFSEIRTSLGMDNQLNVFAFRT